MLPLYLVSTEDLLPLRRFLFFPGVHIPQDGPHMASATPAWNDGPPLQVDYLTVTIRESRSGVED